MTNWRSYGLYLTWFVVCFLAFLYIFLSSACNLDSALKDGIAEGGHNAAKEVMDRFPEITPQLKDAITGAVIAGVDRVIQELKLKPQSSNGWLSSLISAAGLVLAYIVGHRYTWIRAVIDLLKGKACAEDKQSLEAMKKERGV